MAKLYIARVNLITNIKNIYEGENLIKLKQEIYASIPTTCDYTHTIIKKCNGNLIENE